MSQNSNGTIDGDLYDYSKIHTKEKKPVKTKMLEKQILGTFPMQNKIYFEV